MKKKPFKDRDDFINTWTSKLMLERDGWLEYNPRYYVKVMLNQYDEFVIEVNRKSNTVDMRPFTCPSCGRLWNLAEHNACQCGAEINRGKK